MPMLIPGKVAQVQQQFEQEKSAEEQAIRRQHEEELQRLEAEARAQFERDLEAKLAVSRAQWESQLVKEKTQSQVDRELAAVASQERAQFEKTLSAQKRELTAAYETRAQTMRRQFQKSLQVSIGEAKRQAAMQKTYAAVSPRMLRVFRKTELESFREAISAEEEVFQEKLGTWEQEAIGEFETGLETWKVEQVGIQEKAVVEWEREERQQLEKDLVAFKEEAEQQFKEQIADWRATQKAEFEPQIKEWGKAWQPAGLAERMLAWKPELPSMELKIFEVPVKGGKLQVGFDVGKFGEELAGGTAAAGAGIVASAESLVYGVAGIAGVKTPRPPPTLIGAGITAGITSIAAGKLKPSPGLEELTTMKYGFTYAAATLLGDVLLAYGVGKVTAKVAQKAIEPLSKTRLARTIGLQFKMRAPKLALKAVYGKKGAQVILRERQARIIEKTFGAWEPLTTIGVEKAALEARYGMPFYRAETLQMAVPTTEFQRLRYAEWLAPRAAIEVGLTWEIGLAPAAAAKGAEIMRPISLPEMLQQAERMPAYKYERTMMFGLKEGLREQIKMVPAPGRETVWTRRAAFEFEQATKMDLPSRLFIPDISRKAVAKAGEFFIGKGVPVTPFEKTLAKAIGVEVKRAMGGLTAVQLAPQIMREFPRAAPTLAAMPKAPVRMAVRDVAKTLTQVSQAMKPTAKVAMDLSSVIGLGLGIGIVPAETLALEQPVMQIPEEVVTQISEAATKAVQITAVSQVVTGVAPLKEAGLAAPGIAPKMPLVPVKPFLRLPKEEVKKPVRKRKRKRVPWKKRGALFKYPIMPEKDVPSFIFSGLPKTEKQRGGQPSLSNVILGQKRTRRRRK